MSNCQELCKHYHKNKNEEDTNIGWCSGWIASDGNLFWLHPIPEGDWGNSVWPEGAIFPPHFDEKRNVIICGGFEPK